MHDLSNYRKSYEKGELLEDNVPYDPLELFDIWFKEAEKNEKGEANAMTVSTIGLDGFPKSRIVLLKKYSSDGFVFFTNYNSEKGKSIAENPKVCLSFFWENMERQIIIKGNAFKVGDDDSDQYFNSRPIGSQLGAIISNQSEVIPNRNFLEKKLDETMHYYVNHTIVRPSNWGGYIVKPESIEFWQGRPNRLHDRIRYAKTTLVKWFIERLAP
jgi:pyridoxamine 5'-phosphate oxidase